ncbi:MAG: hypothetical protein ACLGHN_13390 [Bacteriovoracia bacterium]
MKVFVVFISFFLLIVSISIPSSFEDLNVFSSGTEVTLDEYLADIEGKTCENEAEEETNEIEETETEFFYSHFSNVHYDINDLIIPPTQVNLVSTYIFTIFIPPLI